MKQFFVILLFAAMFTGAYFVMRKKEEGEEEDTAHDQALRDAFTDALQYFPREVVNNAERIYQLETNGYSKQFTFSTGAAGMDAISVYYPYGWNSLTKFWDKNPIWKPIGMTTDYEYERDNKMPLVVFPSIKAGIMTLCYFLNIHENNAGRWHAIVPAEQILYAQKVSQYTPAYT